MFVLVLNQLITMLIIGVGGFIFAKLFKVEEGNRKFLSKLLLYFINPCVVIQSFNKEFDAEKMKLLIFVFILSFAIHFIMIGVGILSSKNVLDRLGVALTNCGFVGIPLIRGVFGDEGVFFLMGYLVVFNIVVWTYGYYQLSGTISLKKIITNPNIICVILGIIIYCLPCTLPNIIAKPVSMIGDLNTATSMILLGILLADFKLAEGKEYAWDIVKFCLSRLFICGLINIAVLFVVYKVFGFIPNVRMLCFVVLICSMCPAATSIPSLACVFDKNASYASVIVSISSVVCIVSLPIMVALADFILK